LIQFLNTFKLTSALAGTSLASPERERAGDFLPERRVLWHYPCNQRNCKSHTPAHTPAHTHRSSGNY